MELHFFKWTPRDNSNFRKMLVFLHGMGGTGQIWRPIAASLEEEFLCIAPDQRGHGQSRPVPPSESGKFHATDYARDVMELLSRLVPTEKPTEIYLIGHSMGVRTALATAAMITSDAGSALPKNILKGLIAIDIGLQSKWGGGIGTPLADFIRALPKSFPDRATMREHLFAHCPDPAIAQYLSAVARKISDSPEAWAFPFDHEALVQTIHQADDAPIEQWVRDIYAAGVPVLTLRGVNSKVWLKDDYEKSRVALTNPLMTFEEWPDAGHGLPFEQRLKFVERVREFCRS